MSELTAGQLFGLGVMLLTMENEMSRNKECEDCYGLMIFRRP